MNTALSLPALLCSTIIISHRYYSDLIKSYIVFAPNPSTLSLPLTPSCVDMGSTVSIPHADVTFLDANHCPGAALLLFKIKKNVVQVSNSHTSGQVQSRNRKRGKEEEEERGGKGVEYSKIYLHTGDMRYHPRMQQYPALRNIRIDKIFLDTTYAHPKHKVS